MEKLKNFWYHYKFRTIFCLFLAIVIAVSTYSCATKEKYDISVFLYMSRNLSADVEQSLRQAIEETYLQNGEKMNVEVIDFSYDPYTKDGDGKVAYASALSGEMRMKNHFIFITDEYRFEELNNNEKLENLFLSDSSLFNKYQNKAYSFKGTSFEEKYKKILQGNGVVVNEMPELFLSVMNSNDKENGEYKKSLELAKLIIKEK